MADPPRVLIAHDDMLVRDILSSACTGRGIDVAGTAVTYGELVEQLNGLAPDVAIVADHLAEDDIEGALGSLLCSPSRVIVLSADPSPDRTSRLLAADIDGYLSQDATPEEVITAILAVARGEAAINPSVLSTVLYQWRRLRSQPVALGSRRRPSLTPREHDIVCAMADGLAAKAIAARLGMAVKTVENHKIRIFEKLGVKSQAHAVTVAITFGLAGSPAPAGPDGSRQP